MESGVSCISCGMPMFRPGDFAMSDLTRNYCTHCAREDGEMLSFEERLSQYVGWLVSTQGLERTVAIEHARLLMAEMPAWTDKAPNWSRATV